MGLSVQRVVYIMFTALFIVVIHAAATGAEVRYEPSVVKMDGPVVGKTVKIDRTYENKYKKEVLAPFEFVVPRIKGIKVFAAFPPQNIRHEYVKLSFANPNKQLIENLRFNNMSVPMENREKRLALVKQLMVKKALPIAVKGYDNVSYIGGRKTKINGLDAVEVAAKFENKTHGVMYLWLVGIINPNSTHCIIAMSQITLKSDVRVPQDIGQKGISALVLSTFKFIKE